MSLKVRTTTPSTLIVLLLPIFTATNVSGIAAEDFVDESQQTEYLYADAESDNESESSRNYEYDEEDFSQHVPEVVEDLNIFFLVVFSFGFSKLHAVTRYLMMESACHPSK
ncbi:hypothetical protein BC830DRAFT_911031 [Chytriomyces sp. MP71]|nr:hypothetical protein BC830DRAFT_911031 [Chytriomyces sp. MP71]